jgi:hypothetical protein
MSLDRLEELTHRLAELEGFVDDAVTGGLAGAGKWWWDFERDQLWWDDGMYLLFDANKTAFSECVSFFVAHLHPDDRSRIGEYLDNCIKLGLSYAATYRTHTGRRIHAYGTIKEGIMSGVCLPQPECSDE